VHLLEETDVEFVAMDTKLAVGLIVLTAIGTYAVSRRRHHHFESTKLGDGAILLDTETGVECSARFGMKWTDTNKKAVWAAGLEAKKIEAEYIASQSTNPAPAVPIPADATTAPADPFKEFGGHPDVFDLAAAEDKYNQLIQKAESEKIPDPDSSYFKSFPLCKDVR
jgi:hypothetical protein